MRDSIPTSPSDLDTLVAQQVQESLHLDYKRSEALKNLDEISKDVSAFLNSDGGQIVYGISEANGLPERVDGGIDHNLYSRERLESIILSNIAPRPSGIEVVEIPLSDSHSAYAVGIPRATRGPHQDAKTKKYYKRFQFQSVPMEHFEIEDVRARRALLEPLISIDIAIDQGALVELAIENIGSYPATDVTFSFDPPLDFRVGKAVPMLRRGVKYFPPKRRHVVLYDSFFELMGANNVKPTAFTVTVAYRHALSDERIREEFFFDVMDYYMTSDIKSDVQRAGEGAKEAVRRLTDELQRVRQAIESVGSIAGATGLTLSMPTIENLKSIANGSLEAPIADCRTWTPNALMEALRVSADMARAIYSKTYRGDLTEIEAVPGITPEIVAGVRRLYT